MKEVIKTIVIVILAGVAIFYGVRFNKVDKRMGKLNSQDSLQSIQVKKFDHRVHDLELKFKGRGEHIQEFQSRLKEFDQELQNTYDKFNSKVDSLDYVFQGFRQQTENTLDAIKKSQEEMNNRIYEVRNTARDERLKLRQLVRKVSGRLSNLQDEVDNINKQLEQKKKKEQQ